MPDSPETPPAVRSGQLESWFRSWYAPSARIERVRTLTGHGGRTLAFDVRTAGRVRPFVIRLAPPGVVRRGSADLMRQIPLLDRLAQSEVPVPAVVAHTTDPQWFGTDALVQEMIAGAPLHMFERDLSVAPDDAPERYLRHAVAALAGVHRTTVDGWEPPRTIADEMSTWIRLIPRLPEPDWARDAERLADALTSTDPGGHRIGLLHGDFQTNNLLFAAGSGELLAVIDWELAAIGAVGLDVGWLAMMTDPTCWGEPLRSRLLVTAAPGSIHRWYRAESGSDGDIAEWYLALACFRYGVIAGYSVRLHRTGRRIDPFNESLASTVAVLLRRGLAIVG